MDTLASGWSASAGDEDLQTVQACWSCRGPVDTGSVFCDTCAAVQPPAVVDHFTRLGLTVGFDLDATALDRAYFAMQRHLHPDRFVTRGSRERMLSQQQATSINEAYETLRDPLQRADYLVHLMGAGALPEGCTLVGDQELLLETLEVREALAEAETQADVNAIAQRGEEDIRRCIADLSRAFDAGDVEQASRLTTRLKYLRKLMDETRSRRARLRGAN